MEEKIMKTRKNKKLLILSITVSMFLILGIASGSGASVAGTGTQILPTADTYVNASQADANYGAQTTLLVEHSETGFSAGLDEEAYFIYDVSSMSCDTKVQLSLYTISSATLKLAIHEVTNTSWSETELTWNTKPNYEQTTINSTIAQDNKYTYFDITTLAQSHKGGKISFAVVSESDSTSSVWIYSKEYQINDKPYDAPYISCVSTVGQKPTTAPGLTVILLGTSMMMAVVFRKRRFT